MIIAFPTARHQQWHGWKRVSMLGTLLATVGLAGNFNHDGDFEGNGKNEPYGL